MAKPATPRKKGKSATVAEPVSGESKSRSPHLWVRDRFLGERKGVIFSQGRFFEYQRGAFREIQKPQLRKLVADTAEGVSAFEITSSSISSVVDLIRDARSLPDDKMDSNTDVLVFNDCALDLNTFERKPLSHAYWNTSKLPFDYAPDKVSTAWKRWSEHLDPDVLNYMEEYGGLCLSYETRFESSLWLLGKPGCGKGTYTEALRTVVGAQRWTTLSASDMSGRFGLVNLAGKTLAISTERPPINSNRYTDVVNRIISGEPIRVEQKGLPSYDLMPRAKLLWAMNSLPRVNEASNGIFRRARIVKMPDVLKDDESLKPAIMADGQALANVFVAGLRRLRERGHFDLPRSVRLDSEDFHKSNDPVAMFVEEKCRANKEYRQASGLLFDAYRIWCNDNGLRQCLSAIALRPELERLGYRYVRSNGSFYEGIELD